MTIIIIICSAVENCWGKLRSFPIWRSAKWVNSLIIISFCRMRCVVLWFPFLLVRHHDTSSGSTTRSCNSREQVSSYYNAVLCICYMGGGDTRECFSRPRDKYFYQGTEVVFVRTEHADSRVFAVNVDSLDWLQRINFKSTARIEQEVYSQFVFLGHSTPCRSTLSENIHQ